MSVVTLTSPDAAIQAKLSCEGGILSSLMWQGHTSILYRAPWLDDVDTIVDEPLLMQRLEGEWVGVPFGCVNQDDQLFKEAAPHGLPVNGTWHFTAQSPHEACLRYDYPKEYPLEYLERHVALNNEGRIIFRLTLHTREACRFPLGLHPIFPTGDEEGAVEIQVMGGGIVYPTAAEPGISQLLPGARFTNLKDVPSIDGTPRNLSCLPLPYASEEIVQLLAPEGEVTLRYPRRGIQVTLSWDNTVLPNCLLWISNGGRRLSPWNGRNYCLGVEPLCSAWDKGPLSLVDNLISRNNVPTVISLDANTRWTTTYQIHCSELN